MKTEKEIKERLAAHKEHYERFTDSGTIKACSSYQRALEWVLDE